MGIKNWVEGDRLRQVELSIATGQTVLRVEHIVDKQLLVGQLLIIATHELAYQHPVREELVHVCSSL